MPDLDSAGKEFKRQTGIDPALFLEEVSHFLTGEKDEILGRGTEMTITFTKDYKLIGTLVARGNTMTIKRPRKG